MDHGVHEAEAEQVIDRLVREAVRVAQERRRERIEEHGHERDAGARYLREHQVHEQQRAGREEHGQHPHREQPVEPSLKSTA